MKKGINLIDRRSGRAVERNAEAGFTLIEIMVVVVIIGMLAAIVGVNVIGRVGQARQETAKAQIQQLMNALEMYKMDNGFYPTSEQGLQSLITPPTAGNVPKKFPPGGYLRRDTVPPDPWNNAYVYASPGVHGPFDIMSYGADGAPGGDEENTDITSWE